MSQKDQQQGSEGSSVSSINVTSAPPGASVSGGNGDEEVPRFGVPRIAHPGDVGWPEEPKVTQHETILYGSLAGVVRLLGIGSAALENAYQLACKHEAEDIIHDEDEVFAKAVEEAYAAAHQAVRVYLQTASRISAHLAKVTERMDRGEEGGPAEPPEVAEQ